MRNERFIQWEKRWRNTAKAIHAYGGEIFECNKDGKATEKEIKNIEKDLNLTLPEDFKEVLLNFSKSISFRWGVKKDFSPPFDSISGGWLYWNLEELVEINKSKEDLIECCFEEEEEQWKDTLAFIAVGNGDYILMDLKEERGPVKYLSHEHDLRHGCRLANNFSDFVDRVSKIGFIGPEDWHFEPFLRNDLEGIEGDGEIGKSFREMLKLTFDKEISEEEVQALISKIDPLERQIEDYLGDSWERKYEIIIENIETGEQVRNIIPAINGGRFYEEEYRSAVEKEGEYRLVKFEETVNEKFKYN